MRAPLPPRYRLLGWLGRGATAEVLLAHDEELDRAVAVKLFVPELGADPTVPERFAREAMLAARLGRHPHVVTIHDAGRWRGRPFIVMEYERGGSVEERLRAGSVPRERTLRWLRETADAVDAAHAIGIVHRDLKPANLLLDEHDSVRVADFGIARALDEALERLTLTGTILGTAGYISPEQARGEGATPASDRYSLAVVAHELLFGRRPTAESLDPVFVRALASVPELRFSTASAFVDELERQTVSVTAVRRRRPEATEPASQPTAVLRRHRATARAIRFGKRLVLATAVAALAACAAVAFGYIRSDSPASATCTVSPADHDANLVASGIGAETYCAARARELAWPMRPGFALRSPDLGQTLTVVCAVRRGGLRITVYDDGGRRIGRELCGRYAIRGAAVNA